MTFEKSNNDLNFNRWNIGIFLPFSHKQVAELSSNNILSSCKMNNKIPWLLTYELPEWPIIVAEKLHKCISESIPLPSRIRKQIGGIFFQSISTHAL